MKTDWTRVKQPQFLGSINAYSLHVLLATAGSAVLAAVLAALAFLVTGLFDKTIPLAFFQRILVNRYFPLQVALSISLGYLASGKLPNKRYALWSWVVPAGVLAVSLILWRPTTVLGGGWSAVLHHFFGASATGSITNLDQFTRTLPFYTSIGYTTGAAAKDRLSKKIA